MTPIQWLATIFFFGFVLVMVIALVVFVSLMFKRGRPNRPKGKAAAKTHKKRKH